MRVAVMVVSILVVATSSYASDSCMTKGEARKHFATTYLYWHGTDHCWDASPRRRQVARNVQQKNVEPARRQDSETDWHEARSELLPSDTAPSAPQSQPSERDEAPPENSVGVPWADRWVDVAQAARSLDAQSSDPMPSLKTTARNAGSAIAAGGLILILLSGVMMVAVIEFLRRSANL